MWSSRTTLLPGDRTLRCAIDRGSAPLSYLNAIHQWQADADFRAFFIDLLAASPFPAFRWETPPVTTATADRPFEFVILDSPELAGDPDPSAFAEHFAAMPPGGVVEFPNLGKDGIMIVPCPDDARSDYGHLAAFLRHSQTAQQHALWKLAGAAMQRRLSSRPVWLNTAGSGVAWLHVRMDDRPKYYRHSPYRSAG